MPRISKQLDKQIKPLLRNEKQETAKNNNV